jgi:hypothetical protein
MKGIIIMLKSKNEKKDKINILLNVSNFYGKYTGGVGRVLLFIISIVIPFMIYVLVLMKYIRFKYFLFIFILYSIRMFLLIIGKENEKLESFKKQKNDEYSSAKELMKIMEIYEDGMIEYQNGNICYIIQTYGYSYMNDNQYSKDIEDFLSKLTIKYDVDVYGHIVVGENSISQEDLEKLKIYTDKEYMKERLEFYKYQEDFTNNNVNLYRVNYIINGNKNKRNIIKKDINNIIKSEYSECFDIIKLCDRKEANDVISRDLTVYVDIEEMLHNKMNLNNYFGSKVLYFDEPNIEDSLDKIIFEKEERRIIDDK